MGLPRRPPRIATLLAAALAAATACSPRAYPHAREPIGTVQQSYDGALTPELAVSTFRNIHRLFPTRTVAPARTPRPLPRAASPLPPIQVTQGGTTYTVEDWIRLNRVTGLLVLRDGAIVDERYLAGNTPRTRWMSMSIAKSVTATLVGAALHDGSLHSLDDSVTRYVPRLAGSAYAGVSVRDVLMMASGVAWTETYTNPASDRRRLLAAQVSQRPGAVLDVMASLPRAAPPGTRHTYSTGETQVVGEVVRGATGLPLAHYLAERVWKPAGMEAPATWWLDAPDGHEIGGSGLSATLRDYGRLGLFLLEDGVAAGRRYLPPGWAIDAGQPRQLRDGTTIPYGYLWWSAERPSAVADRAFSAQGIHGQYLYINPAARVVIVVWSAQPQPVGGDQVRDALVFEAIAAALR